MTRAEPVAVKTDHLTPQSIRETFLVQYLSGCEMQNGERWTVMSAAIHSPLVTTSERHIFDLKGFEAVERWGKKPDVAGASWTKLDSDFLYGEKSSATDPTVSS